MIPQLLHSTAPACSLPDILRVALLCACAFVCLRRYYDGKGEAASGLTPAHGGHYDVRADVGDANMTAADAEVRSQSSSQNSPSPLCVGPSNLFLTSHLLFCGAHIPPFLNTCHLELLCAS